MSSSASNPRYPVEVTHLPLVRCAVCRRTVAHPPGRAGAVLTKHYQRAHPEILNATSGPWSKQPYSGERNMRTSP